jgi:hypothetical protein
METIAIIVFLAMGSTINNLENEVATLGYFQEQNTMESIKQQEQINDLIISTEKLEIQVKELEKTTEMRHLALSGAIASKYARHETFHDMQQIQIDIMEMRQDDILEKMLAAGE